MNQIRSLEHFLKKINSLEIKYMITGAYAVSYYGLPRSTHDLDVVIAIKKTDVEQICRSLKKDYIIDREMIENAVQFHTHFSIVHSTSNFKADFWILKPKENELKKFNRRIKTSLFGIATFIISPEDLIITKLEWYKRSKHQKHLDDAKGIINVQAGRLDERYLSSLVEECSLKKYWKTAVHK